MAVSNVSGSNIFNLMVVCGACALFAPLTIEKNTLMKEFPFSIVCAGLLVVFGFIGMKLGRVDGIIFLVIFVAYLLWMIYSAKKARSEGDKFETEEEEMAEEIKILPMWKCLLYIVEGEDCDSAAATGIHGFPFRLRIQDFERKTCDFHR